MDRQEVPTATTKRESGSGNSIDQGLDQDREEGSVPRRQLTAEQHGVMRGLDEGEVITPDSLAVFADAHGYHAHRQGRLVLELAEARKEYGPEIADRLQVDDNDIILWPQPTRSPDDPQNWSEGRKALILTVATMAAFVPDFSSGLGIAGLFGLAATFNTTTNNINNVTSNWSIFLLGPGGVVAVWLCRRYGRLPVMFWSQLIGLLFLIGCAVSQSLASFAACRCLNAFFSTAPQVLGLFIVTDLWPAHRQGRKLGIWTAGFILSPFTSPWLAGYIIAKASWRWGYAFGIFYAALVVVLIVLFMEETLYDRYTRPIPARPTQGMRYRVETLLGITGVKMARYRVTIWRAAFDTVDVLWRPQLWLTCAFVALAFGFSIGINVTAPVFLGEPVVIGGRGLNEYSLSTMYLTPIVAVLLGETAGRYLNDLIARRLTHKNAGVFEAEMVLWGWYAAMPLFVAGFVLLGASFEKQLNLAGVIFGWGIAQFAVLVITVIGYSYLNSCFPTRRGEASALLNWARVLVGFAVPYFQTTWADEHGALQTFGCEGAIVAGFFFLIVPFLQLRGASMRERYSIYDKNIMGDAQPASGMGTHNKGDMVHSEKHMGSAPTAA